MIVDYSCCSSRLFQKLTRSGSVGKLHPVLTKWTSRKNHELSQKCDFFFFFFFFSHTIHNRTKVEEEAPARAVVRGREGKVAGAGSAPFAAAQTTLQRIVPTILLSRRTAMSGRLSLPSSLTISARRLTKRRNDRPDKRRKSV
jgi:hypothetical protein